MALRACHFTSQLPPGPDAFVLSPGFPSTGVGVTQTTSGPSALPTWHPFPAYRVSCVTPCGDCWAADGVQLLACCSLALLSPEKHKACLSRCPDSCGQVHCGQNSLYQSLPHPQSLAGDVSAPTCTQGQELQGGQAARGRPGQGRPGTHSVSGWQALACAQASPGSPPFPRSVGF